MNGSGVSWVLREETFARFAIMTVGGRQWGCLAEVDKWVGEKEDISISFFCSNAWGYGIEGMGGGLNMPLKQTLQMVKGTVGSRVECFAFGKS
ncbi:hypothetical protein F7984_09050 [Pradoshia sp. D12]|uniref:hypothetical protein n=1 Tax=Bacillaceae TaxID=186817 RepID=UPI001112101F|nr:MULTISPECIES: hypothetical protein [Bacillaceae]QFK71369.1 hypothetical protein F7984_09050 [Pradoshia sp. D12]